MMRTSTWGLGLFVVVALGCDTKGAAKAESDAAPVVSAPVLSPSSSQAAATVESAAPSAAVSAAAAPARAATYGWTDEPTLTGTLTQKEVASAKGGTLKTPFLVLDAPISLRKGRPEANETEVSGIRELWIGNLRDESGKFSKLPDSAYGTKASLKAKFQPESTGHHHSNPWIDGRLVGPLAAGSAKKVSASAKVIDTSDWAGTPAGATLDLRWTIDQSKATPPIVVDKTGPQGDLTKTKVPVDLVLGLNGKKHSLSFQANGGVTTADPKVCPQVSFYWADTLLVFALARAEGGKAVIVKRLAGKEEQVYAFDLPADVKVTQEVAIVAPDGKKTTTTCSAPALP
jgi:hypothetical protein